MGSGSSKRIQQEAKPSETMVFLGGTCGSSTWRGDIACPILDSLGVTYWNPQVPADKWKPEMIPAENRAKETARVLLFVVDGSTRGVMSMVEAAYYMGAGRRVVLFIEDVPDSFSSSEEEVKDLNRGRKYLRTLGNEVTDSIDAAVRRAAFLACQ
jgi:hypothetical protein